MKLKNVATAALAAVSVIAAYGAAPQTDGNPAEAAKPYTVYMVSNSHLDTQWRWDIRLTIDEYLYNAVVQNLALLDRYPHYVFNFEGAVKYKWIKEYYPDLYARIGEYVRQGRWNLSGASWDANDPNIPSSESFIRNILLAQEFYKREFGKVSRDLFLPDCFGFSQTIPTLGSHCGLIGLSTQKLSWRSQPLVGDRKAPFAVGLWQGVDGSRIMAALEPGGYWWRDLPEGDLTQNETFIKNAQASPDGKAYRYFGNSLANGKGDRGGSTVPRSVEIIGEAIADGKGPVRIVCATSSQLYEEYLPFDKHPELPVFDGEMPLDVHAPGCYTAHSEMKRYNRRNEQLADAAERSAVMADWLGGAEYPKAEIDDAWQRFLWHQFHDDLTGTSIWQAYTYSWNDEYLAQSRFCDAIDASTAAVASVLDTQTQGLPIVVYNPTAYERRSVVEAEIELDPAVADVTVYDADGRRTASQIIAREGRRAKILFAARVPSVGYAVYEVREGAAELKGRLKVSGNVIENAVYRVTVDRVTGDISSVVDKRYGRELVAAGKAFGLQVLTPNVSDKYPAWEIRKETLDREPERVADGVKITVAECGAVRAALRVERRYGDSRFIQLIRLTDGGDDDRIDIVTDADWRTPNALLKAAFPTSVSSDEAVYDVGIGVQYRRTNTLRAHETFAHHWADLSDGKYGVAVLDNSKYGWDKPNANTLRLSLLHTPSAKRRFTDQAELDFGLHTMTYSIVSHRGDYAAARLAEKGEALNRPLMAFVASKHGGKVGRRFSFVASASAQLAVKAVKKAENGDGYIVRLYETAGRAADNVAVTFAAPIVSAEEVNGIEERKGDARFDGNRLYVSAGKFAPVSFRVRLAEADYGVTPAEHRFVGLPYNCNAISSDQFKSLAGMDAGYNSFAAEIMPEIITYMGVPFRRGRADVKNALNCAESVVIPLPDGKYDKVHILAAATDGDRAATFEIDGCKYEVVVPQYDGFRAQWAWSDRTSSFVKEGRIAYIGDHRHKMNGRNEAYAQTYLYDLVLDVDDGVRELRLPEDKNITVFAVTVSRSGFDDVERACEPRALPMTELK